MATLPIVTAQAILEGLRALGHDADAYADAVGLPGSDLHDPYATVPSEVFGRIWELAFEEDPRPHLPAQVGYAVPFGAFGLLDYLVGSAPTVGQGLAALARTFRLVAATARLELRTRAEKSVWIHNEPASPTDVVGDVFTLAVIASRFGARLPASTPSEIHLTQPAGPPVEPFERAFGCPVMLGRPRSGMRFSPETWMQTLSRADSALHATLCALAERADVKSYVTGPVSYSIRLRLPDMLKEGQADAEHVAASLGFSLRTLQRRLSGEGASFEALVDDVRRREAARLLGDRRNRISEVARHLGYLEPASFTRAFRRWYGMAPSDWRRQQSKKD